MIKFILLSLVTGSTWGTHAPLKPWLPAKTNGKWTAKIIDGVDAEPGQFPYIASLRYSDNLDQACGASILTKDWLLTAAHCCVTDYELVVYTGSIYLSQGGEFRNISEYVVHAEYDADDYWRNDICVINVASPITLNENATQVILPTQDQDVTPEELLIIPGWGNLASGRFPDRLQVLYNDSALTNEDCSDTLSVNITSGQICTFKQQGQSVCSGDSGGPLTSSDVQVGLTSWGYFPCGQGTPDVFTRVPYYVDWIANAIGASAEDLKFSNH